MSLSAYAIGLGVWVVATRDDESDQRYEETDADRETERLKGLRMGLFGAESASKEPEPW